MDEFMLGLIDHLTAALNSADEVIAWRTWDAAIVPAQEH
jgi:hypothetical protein